MVHSTTQRSVVKALSTATLKRQHAARARCLVEPPTLGEATDPLGRRCPAAIPTSAAGPPRRAAGRARQPRTLAAATRGTGAAGSTLRGRGGGGRPRW